MGEMVLDPMNRALDNLGQEMPFAGDQRRSDACAGF